MKIHETHAYFLSSQGYPFYIYFERFQNMKFSIFLKSVKPEHFALIKLKVRKLYYLKEV